MNLNKVILIGRVTQNPEVKTIPSGQMVCTFSLATNRTWTNQDTKQKEEKTEFHNIILWRRLAEIASQYMTKGSLIMVEGRLQTSSWQAADGTKKSRLEVIASRVQILVRSEQASVEKTKVENADNEYVSESDVNMGDEEVPF